MSSYLDQLSQRIDRLNDRVDDVVDRQNSFEALVSNHTREVSNLATNVGRLSQAVEAAQLGQLSLGSPRLPAKSEPELRTSWHQKIGRKQISVPAAGGWSVLAYFLLELARAVADGRITFH